MKKIGKLSLYIIYLIVIVFFSLEIVVRIWKPVPIRLKGNKILLDTNTINTYNNPNITSKLDSEIHISTNSLGFRGPEPPLDFSNYLSIVTIGGSTTKSVMISDGKTWPDLLSGKLSKNFNHLWLNNAGIDGQSTYGNFELLNQYIIKLAPKVAIYLVGINDMIIDQAKIYDKQDLITSMTSPNKNVFDFFSRYSDLFALYVNVDKTVKAKKFGLSADRIVDYKVLGVSTENISGENSAKYPFKSLQEYKERLKSIIILSRKYGIYPIFMTQPTAYGFGVDDETGVDLGNIIVSDFTTNGQPITGRANWEILQSYNDTLKQVAEEEGVEVIDLANSMPKSSKYYYDLIHFSNDGSRKVAELVYPEICQILSTKFKNYALSDCSFQ